MWCSWKHWRPSGELSNAHVLVYIIKRCLWSPRPASRNLTDLDRWRDAPYLLPQCACGLKPSTPKISHHLTNALQVSPSKCKYAVPIRSLHSTGGSVSYKPAGVNMPDVVHAFQHACMLHNHNLQFEDAKHEETSLHVCPAEGGRKRLVEPFKFLDAKWGGRGTKSPSSFWTPTITRPLSEHRTLQATRG